MPLKEEFNTYISQEEGAPHHATQGHKGSTRFGQEQKEQGGPKLKPFLGFPQERPGRWGNGFGLTSSGVVVGSGLEGWSLVVWYLPWELQCSLVCESDKGSGWECGLGVGCFVYERCVRRQVSLLSLGII